MDSLLGRILKLIFGSIVVGLFSGLIIPLVINAFSSDGSFELWELLLTFLIIIIILVFLVRFLTHHLSRIIAIKPHIDFNFTQFKFLSIPGVLTGIIPMGGGLFGGSGNEPIWIFILLGIVGSFFWSIPLFLWLLNDEKDDQVDPYVPPVADIAKSEQPTHSNMNWYNWYFEVLKKYVVFKGRARRKEYWMFNLFNFIISFNK